MNKREKQIEIITQNNINDISSICSPTDEYIKGYTHGFKEGAKWADEHPNWISVENELPVSGFKNSAFSKDVLIEIYGNIYVGYYVIHKKEWVLYNPDADYDSSMITHWMPFPKFIKNEDSYEENNYIVSGHYKHDFL